MLDQFVELSQRIVQSNAGFNTSLPVLTHVVTQGMLWALRGAPARLPFLQASRNWSPGQAELCLGVGEALMN